MIQLSQEQRKALSKGHNRIEFEDPVTKKVYVLAERETLFKAHGCESDLAALIEGLADLRTGQVRPLKEVAGDVREQLCQKYGLPFPDAE